MATAIVDGVRKFSQNYILSSVKQIDSSSWLFGSLILRRSTSPSNTATWVDENDNSSYTLEAAPASPPSTSPVESPHVTLVYRCGGASAVWSIGSNAFCKVRFITEGVTPESVTLNFVRDQQPSFQTPKVFNHSFDDHLSYLFLQRLPGRTLATAWPTLSEFWRYHYVETVASACLEMAKWTSPRLGGVDSQNIAEYYLQWKGSSEFDNAQLQAKCEAIGMDCSNFYFYHADLGPGNIIVEDEPSTGEIGIIDYEIAGYLPSGWVRTKFRLSSGLDIPGVEDYEGKTRWRSEVFAALGTFGFEDHTAGWRETCEMTRAPYF
ncbi:hypothetical protein E2P81_ATG06585 [Venturia nashicola]|uniref:Aminoglycoside phosphotransferase domain-containing protein n=1 Tax=Venturia nashicola TaxID=86259 RepID=A0A4Z1P054_9PEZI|nr:hypothetical protein E6O75_ATG06754 [Venturia nashicola]TLD29932.1 hypothetical protein E2P81_ATG06585 [Venturia nashicola]